MGMTEAMKVVPLIALVLAISGIVVGAGAMVLSTFGDTTDKCYNSSWTINALGTGCTNNTAVSGAAGTDNLNLSNQYYSIHQAQEGVGSIAEQLPTVAIIGIMVVIIGLIVGVLGIMRMN